MPRWPLPRCDGGEHDVELGDAAVGDPRLLAVEDVAAVDRGARSSGSRRRRSRRRARSSRARSSAASRRSSGRTQRSFCASVPSASTGSAKKPPEVMRLPIPEQPWQSSSCTTQPVRTSVIPPPPSSSGIMNEVSPRPAALCKISHGDLDVGLVDGGRDRPDLARGEIAADAPDLLLLGREVERGAGRGGARHARHRTGAAGPGARGVLASLLSCEPDARRKRRNGIRARRFSPTRRSHTSSGCPFSWHRKNGPPRLPDSPASIQRQISALEKAAETNSTKPTPPAITDYILLFGVSLVATWVAGLAANWLENMASGWVGHSLAASPFLRQAHGEYF